MAVHTGCWKKQWKKLPHFSNKNLYSIHQVKSQVTGNVPLWPQCLKKAVRKKPAGPVSLTSVPCKILEHIFFHHNYYGSLGRASCTCQLPAWISPGPLMWKPANYNSWTPSQKLRPWQTDWFIIAGLLQGIWYGPTQMFPQEIRSLRNPWTTDQMDRILALRKNSHSCC